MTVMHIEDTLVFYFQEIHMVLLLSSHFAQE